MLNSKGVGRSSGFDSDRRLPVTQLSDLSYNSLKLSCRFLAVGVG